MPIFNNKVRLQNRQTVILNIRYLLRVSLQTYKLDIQDTILITRNKSDIGILLLLPHIL
jgi:hypothetical protein